MGRRHIAHLQAVGCEVTAIDPSEAARGRVRGEWPTISICGVLPGEETYDALVIASPASTHVEWLCEALRRRVPCFIEKPLAMSVADVMPMGSWTTLARYAPIVQVGYQFRFHDGARLFREIVHDRVLGDPLLGRFYAGSLLASWGGADYADALLEGSHELDVATWVLGPAHVVGAAAAHRSGGAWELLLRHASGILSNVHVNVLQADYCRGWRVVCARGTVYFSWDNTKAACVLTKNQQDVAHLHWQATPTDALAAAYLGELAAFLGTLRHGQRHPDACTLDQALEVLALCDRARELAERAA
jgi:predicted dehydrogenase